jgi:hypothetical protein
MLRLVGVLVISMVVAVCGDSPLESVGQRSSGWINEPVVTTTTAVVVTAPVAVGVQTLSWSNDAIVTQNLFDPVLLVSEVFSRREGDRFIQASRAEISTMLPGVQFPARVPFGAEWVTSQLVINNSGELSDDPSAAFGIWSAEPYTRSRSVAQIAILRVANDKETATEIAQSGEEPSCARFADRTTNSCEVFDIANRTVWSLTSNQGTTLVWFDETFRYEMFGRPFVPFEALIGMTAESVPLADLGTVTS